MVFRNTQGTGDDIFLNIHAQPNQERNEVPTQLNVIRGHMNKRKQSASTSWLLVGDYNREPQSLSLITDKEKSVSPSEKTHGNKVLDYLIYGSSNGNTFKEMEKSKYQAKVWHNRLTDSDHKAVFFSLIKKQ